MISEMSREPTQRSRATRQSYRSRRRLRLAGGIALIFVLGIALGATFGTWLARTEKPQAQVALKPDEVPYEVTARAYRPPVRRPYKAKNPKPSKLEAPLRTDLDKVPADLPTQTALPADTVAEVETAPTQSAPRKASEEPELALAPRIRGGKTPKWLANAVASPATKGRPMIALVIDDLGLSRARALRTISLPAPITLAFLPYGNNLRKLADASRSAGHELIIHVNMEPKDHDVDPGPQALLTSLSTDEVRDRLEWALGQFDGYIGISNHMGSRFTEWPDGMETVIRVLKRRGLLFFDSVTSTKSVGPALARAHGMAHASRDVFLDHDRSSKSIKRQLAETERIARRRGHAIAIGHPYDVTFEALKAWMPDVVARGFQLVPLSAIARRRLGEG